MQDADEEEREQRKRAFYPLHQPENVGRERHDPFDAQTEPELGEEKPRRRSRAPLHQREQIDTPQLPHGRLRNALIIGAIFGILSAAQNIIITLVILAPILEDFAKATKGSVTYNALAFQITGFGVLIFFISLVLYFIGGLIAGRVAVHRRLGFIAGFLAGAIYYVVAIFAVRYIQGYPGNLASSGGDPLATTAGIILVLVILIITGLIGGGMGLLGAWLATRRHPFYVGYAG